MFLFSGVKTCLEMILLTFPLLSKTLIRCLECLLCPDDTVLTEALVETCLLLTTSILERSLGNVSILELNYFFSFLLDKMFAQCKGCVDAEWEFGN